MRFLIFTSLELILLTGLTFSTLMCLRLRFYCCWASGLESDYESYPSLLWERQLRFVNSKKERKKRKITDLFRNERHFKSCWSPISNIIQVLFRQNFALTNISYFFLIRHRQRLAKAWAAINRLSVIWNSDLTDKIKGSFFQVAVVSILIYGCTTWTLTKLDSNYTRMLTATLNKSCWQQPTKQQIYGHLPPITKTIQVRRTRHAGYYWRSKDEIISDVLLWTPSQGRAKVGQPVRTYIQQLCADKRYGLEDLPGAIDDRGGWRERVREIHVSSTAWWWWWWWWWLIRAKQS